MTLSDAIARLEDASDSTSAEAERLQAEQATLPRALEDVLECVDERFKTSVGDASRSAATLVGEAIEAWQGDISTAVSALRDHIQDVRDGLCHRASDRADTAHETRPDDGRSPSSLENLNDATDLLEMLGDVPEIPFGGEISTVAVAYRLMHIIGSTYFDWRHPRSIATSWWKYFGL